MQVEGFYARAQAHDGAPWLSVRLSAHHIGEWVACHTAPAFWGLETLLKVTSFAVSRSHFATYRQGGSSERI